MTKEEFNELFRRYARHSISIVDELVDTAEDRRGFIMEYFSFQVEEGINMSRDSYRGHLITLLVQGLKQNLPLDYILEEMEHYRLEMIHTLEKEEGIENLLILLDKSVYEEGDKPKIRAVLEVLVKISVIRHLRQVIKHDYPLALNDNAPQMPAIFNITDDFFPLRFERVKMIPVQEATVSAITKTKERRIDYPEEMNAQEAAEYLNTTKKNLYQMTSSRIVPHYKRGRKLMFRKSELENWHVEKVTSGDEQKIQSANHLLSRKKKR